MVLDARFEEEINHDLIGTIASGTISTEYYWLDRWYNIFRFATPEGQLKSYYCNINVPPIFNGHTLSYIDLDIDVLIQPDLSYRVLDTEDFESNAARYRYAADVRQQAAMSLTELTRLIETREFPFGR